MPDIEREVALIERLIADPNVRREFLNTPQRILSDFSLEALAPALVASPHTPRSIDTRESRSGLGGLAAAAIVAVGALEFADEAQASSTTTAVEAATPPGAPVGNTVVAAAPPIAPTLLVGPSASGPQASEFHLADPEGAPGPGGPVHAGFDLFASAGAPVHSTVAGVVIEVSPSRGTTGQVFGGVVKVQAADERIWVFRHVVPGTIEVGARVVAGQEIATVSSWTGGTPHVHLELWRTLEGGYRVENMDDPHAELVALYSGSGTVATVGSEAPSAVAAGTSPMSMGRASGVFRVVGSGEPPAPNAAPVEAGAPIEVGPVGDYPGDTAPPEAIARWMGATAAEAGLPPELPVMASLVESGLRNLNYGDRDSVGFFQMRTGIWNTGVYAGYPTRPNLQMQWFIDRALAVKADRIAGGNASFGSDPATFGEWVADIERPAEQYRGRYQLRWEDARGLLR